MQDVGGQAGRIGGAGHRVAGFGVRGTERGDRLGDLFGGEADLFGEVGENRIVAHLAKDAVQQTHHMSPARVGSRGRGA